MAELPSGTVTFLFTDIEGSTTLLHELGPDRYADALAEHRRVLRSSFRAHGGVEVDTQGDAFFIAFSTAPSALQAAAEANERLALGQIRVRIGIHTGTPHVTEEGYVGVDVHRAARIAACGHGGQVLVSAPTASLLETDGLRDLGEHRLKDLSAPERIYQLGDESFPPLTSLNQTNLPITTTPFLGREQELAQILDLAAQEGVRLVTLTGAGGTGKTRLALQAAGELAERYPHGVWWVPLASLRNAELVLPTAAQALGAKDGLAEHIADRSLLLLLDNFEHLVEAAPELSRLLALCANLDLLVTSREPVHVTGEQEYPVPPLAHEEGVGLFLARARAVQPDFKDSSAVSEICRRLDELPLALELAAARVKALSSEQLLERLDQRLPLLTGGARDLPERQRTLRATIAWSYELLEPEEQRAFASLSVFSGGCTLEAAEEVTQADLDTLQTLVDKSLVRHAGNRFWMLETIREYAASQLPDGVDFEALRRRHALHYVALGERAEPELRGPNQRGWLDRLELDHDNLRAAQSWSRERDADLGLRLASALWRFWRTHNHLAEGTQVLEGVLQIGEAGPPRLRARALVGASRLALDQGDLERSVACGQEALDAAQALDAAPEIAAATENLGIALAVTGATSEALALLENSVKCFIEVGDPIATADALNNLGNALLELGETARAGEVLEEALTLQRGVENVWGIQATLHTLGYVALHEGDLELSHERLEESLMLSQELDYVSGVAWALEGLAHHAAAHGEDHRAAVLWAAGESIRVEAGVYMQPSEAAIHADALSLVLARLGEVEADAAWVEGSTLAPEDAVAYAVP